MNHSVDKPREEHAPAPAGTPGVESRVRSLAVAWAINTLAYSIVYPFLPIYLHSERQIPLSTSGLVFPAMGVAAMIGSPISGVLIDRYGWRKVLEGGSVARGFVFFALALLTYYDAPFWTFAAGLFLNAFFGAFFQNASDAFVADAVPPERRIRVFSSIRVGVNVGWMIGPAIGAFLARTPFGLLFFATGVLCLLSTFIARHSLHGAVPHLTPEERRLGDRAFVGVLLRDRPMLLLLGLSFVLFLSVSQFVSTLSVYVTEVAGVGKTPLGFLYTINGAMVILFLVPLNGLFKEANIYRRIGLGALLYVAAYLGFAFATKWVHFALLMVVLTTGEMLSVAVIVTAASYRAGQGMVGRYMGLMGMARNVGYAVGPYFGAILLERLSHRPLTLWVCMSSCAFLAGCGFLIMARHAPTHRAEP